MNATVSQKIELFFANYRLRSLDEGQILTHAGEDPPGVTHLISGQVRQYEITERGNELVLNTFKPPAFFPMSWAVNKTPNQFFFEAATPVTFRQAPADEAVAFIKANPDVMFDLLQRTYRGTDGLLLRMASIMDGTAYKRVLLELLIMCRRFGEQNGEGEYIISIHENDLAQNAGLSRETVSRELQKAKTSGLVRTARKSIIVRDVQALESELGFKV
jgi:CRP/FNR family transcriptional regulator, cyclic AMP receptor protein